MGRQKIYTEEELRIKRNERRMAYYWKNRKNELQSSKERYHKSKSADEVSDPIKPIRKATVWGTDEVEDVDDITFEPFEDNESGDYEGTVI